MSEEPTDIHICHIPPGTTVSGPCLQALVDQWILRHLDLPQSLALHIIEEFQPAEED